MKILQICFIPVINSTGGAEKVFCNYANVFLQRQHQVINVCCDNNSGRPFYPLSEEVKFINLLSNNKLKFPLQVKVHNEIVRFCKLLGCTFEFPKDVYKRKYITEKLNVLLKLEQPDVIICYEPRSMLAIADCGFALNKVIVMMHTDADSELKALSKKQVSILKRVRYVQVLMEADVKKFSKEGYNNVVRIANIVPEYSEVNFNKKENTVIHVGRLDKNNKRQHLLIEAFAMIADKYPNWQVKFFGGDSRPKDYQNYLGGLIKKYKLENQVFLMGMSKNIPEELAKADIFAFPSAFEGFGLALTEAMSAGLPVVGFKTCPAVNEIIKDGKNGILCDDNVESLSKALGALMCNEELRIKYGKQGKLDMKEYTLDAIMKKWEELLKTI